MNQQNPRNGEATDRHTRLPAKTIYAIVSREGSEELARPVNSLWWSGVAAGIAISASVVAKAALQLALPDTPLKDVIANLGYCVGFILVVLGRMQLFTENTITVVLPLITSFSRDCLLCTLRLWSVVFAANLVGTFIAAFFSDVVGMATAEQLAAYQDLGRHLMGKDWMQMLLHAIPAGFFIAAMVWMLPSARGFELWVIVIATYLIAIGDFAHVIVGSMEVFLLVLAGEVSVWGMVWDFLIPVLLGNVIGGTVLFSLLAYGQVKEELD